MLTLVSENNDSPIAQMAARVTYTLWAVILSGHGEYSISIDKFFLYA